MGAAQNPSILSVRVSGEERALLEAAAEKSRATLSDFVRRKALEAAEAEILERSVVTIPAADWEAFEAWANRPASVNSGLRDLMNQKPVWER